MRKYIFAALFSFSALVGPIPYPTIVYTCVGEDMFPRFYGSPFIYKATSLATSMAYDYFLYGFLANLILWVTLLLLLNYAIHKFVLPAQHSLKKYLGYLFKAIAVIYMVFALLVLSSGGNTLKTSINLDKEAADWGMTCDGHLDLFE